MRVSIVGGGIQYEKMFIGRGYDVDVISKVGDVSVQSDLIVFTGGGDIDPELYDQVEHPLTAFTSRARDSNERAIYTKVVTLGIPVVGICRGAQLLCVLNGGKLIQHATGHALGGTHKMITWDGDEIEVTSTHHQIMQPATHAKVLAWAEGLSDTYGGSAGAVATLDVKGMEPEVVAWDMSDSIGFQYHPEYMHLESNAVEYFFELCEEMINAT